jgi:hypothetical protein
MARGARLYDAMILMLAHALRSDQNLKARTNLFTPII